MAPGAGSLRAYGDMARMRTDASRPTQSLMRGSKAFLTRFLPLKRDQALGRFECPTASAGRVERGARRGGIVVVRHDMWQIGGSVDYLGLNDCRRIPDPVTRLRLG